MLQCVAVCCSVRARESLIHMNKTRVLQCVAVCCSVLQCVAVCCSVRARESLIHMNKTHLTNMKEFSL